MPGWLLEDLSCLTEDRAGDVDAQSARRLHVDGETARAVDGIRNGDARGAALARDLRGELPGADADVAVVRADGGERSRLGEAVEEAEERQLALGGEPQHEGEDLAVEDARLGREPQRVHARAQPGQDGLDLL